MERLNVLDGVDDEPTYIFKLGRTLSVFKTINYEENVKWAYFFDFTLPFTKLKMTFIFGSRVL